jgi:hypothetical protein
VHSQIAFWGSVIAHLTCIPRSRPAGVAARRSFATTRVARMTPEEDAFFTELAGDLHGHDTK